DAIVADQLSLNHGFLFGPRRELLRALLPAGDEIGARLSHGHVTAEGRRRGLGRCAGDQRRWHRRVHLRDGITGGPRCARWWSVARGCTCASCLRSGRVVIVFAGAHTQKQHERRCAENGCRINHGSNGLEGGGANGSVTLQSPEGKASENPSGLYSQCHGSTW